MVDLSAYSFHTPRNFVPESDWQRINRGDASAIVSIRVADPAGFDSDQDFGRADLWKWNLGIFQRFADLHELDSPHKTGGQRSEDRGQRPEFKSEKPPVQLVPMLMLVIMIEISLAANIERRTPNAE